MHRGPVVIRSFLGIFVNIKTTVHIQMIIPKISIISEIKKSVQFDPPSEKTAGKYIFANTPAIRNGRVKIPIFLPLPTKTFSFILNCY